MEVKTTILPGQNGTKQLLSQYGDQLVCVRYRYDKQKQKRYKTIDLIIDEQDWIPGVTISPDKLVDLRIGFGETELRETIKQNGGFWNKNKKTWRLSYHKALRLGLDKRIVDPALDF